MFYTLVQNQDGRYLKKGREMQCGCLSFNVGVSGAWQDRWNLGTGVNVVTSLATLASRETFNLKAR